MKVSTQWLNEINPNWDIAIPKSIFSERSTRSLPGDIHLTPSQIYGVLPQSEYMEKSGTGIVLNLVGSDNMKHVEVNDFIIHLRSFQGGIEHSPFDGKVSNAYCVLQPKAGIEPGFFRWVLKSNGYIQELNSTTNQLRDGQSIKFEQFASIGLPKPPIDEQRKIADFLDLQVNSIDEVIRLKLELISQYNKLIESKIHELVTGFCKSLVTSTGLEWIPLIPESWKKRPLRELFSWNKGKDPARLDVIYCSENPGEYPVFSGQTSNGGVFASIDTYDFDSLGDCALISTVGALAGSMRVISGKFSLSQNCAIIFPRSEEANVKYLNYLWPSVWSVLKSKIPSDMQPSVRLSDLAETWICTPPLAEQNIIVQEIETETKQLRILIQTTEDLVRYLSEYKASLITSTVTGIFNPTTRKSVA